MPLKNCKNTNSFMNPLLSFCSWHKFWAKICTTFRCYLQQTSWLHSKTIQSALSSSALLLYFIREKLHFLILKPFMFDELFPWTNTDSKSAVGFKYKYLAKCVSENHSNMVVLFSGDSSLKEGWSLFASEK